MSVFDSQAEPTTITTGRGTAQTKTFTLPDGSAIKPESIVADVAYGGALRSPVLTIKSPGGAVIARVPQRDIPDSGDTGDATWALRLSDAAAAAASGAVEYGWYSISNTSHPNTGLQVLTMVLDETSDGAIFDTNSGYARVQAGVYNISAKLNWGQAQTFNAGAFQYVEFGLTVDSFPYFTLGHIGEIRPFSTAGNVTVWTMEFQGHFIADAAHRLRLHIASTGGVARSIGDCTLAIERIRPFV